jgi:hypothetical protein
MPCPVSRQVEEQVNITRPQLIGAVAVRMEEGKIQDIKGLKKRAIQRLDYGASIKYRAMSGEPDFPDRECVSWRQTGGCDGENGASEPEFDKDCTELIPNGPPGYCECVG